MTRDNEPAEFDREYEALRNGRGFVDLSGWSCISVTGADRLAFLHNFCTNDVKRLVPGSSCEAFFTDVKGKIVGHGVISCRDREAVIFGAPGQAARLIKHLDRYVIREDVALFDATTERVHFVVNKEFSSGVEHVVFSWGLLGEGLGKIVEVLTKDVVELLAAFRDREFVSLGVAAFTAARIEAGMPLMGIDFDEHNLPQEVGRDRQAISFTKGCYLGQETVARIDALGHVNQRIAGARFDSSEVPGRGVELTHGSAAVGRVTSVCFSPRLNAPLGLAMMRREANSSGTRIDSPAGECEVVALPIGAMPNG